MEITLIVGFGRMTLCNPINKEHYVLKQHLFLPFDSRSKIF